MKCQRRTCLHCHQLFIPDKYNHHHQRYCSEPPCRRISAQQKRRRWRQKHRYDLDFRAREVERVRKWRQQHPDYRQRQKTSDHDPPVRSIGSIPANSPSIPVDHLVPPAPPTITPEDLKSLRDRVEQQADILAGLAWQTIGAHPDQVTAFISRCYEQGRQLREMAPG